MQETNQNNPNAYRHTHNGIDSPFIETYQYINLRLLFFTDNTYVATGFEGTYVMPYSGRVVDIGATVDTAGTGGGTLTTIDVNNNGTSILSTKITIDPTETSSRTAATKFKLSNPNFKTGDIFTFDIDTISTVAAKGLTVFMKILIYQ